MGPPWRVGSRQTHIRCCSSLCLLPAAQCVLLGCSRRVFLGVPLVPPYCSKPHTCQPCTAFFNIDVFMQHFKMLRGCFSYGHTPCASDRGVLWGDGTLQLLQMRATLFYGLTRRAFRDKHSDSPQRFQLLEEHPLLSAGTFWCRVFQLRSVQSFTRGPLDAPRSSLCNALALGLGSAESSGV